MQESGRIEFTPSVKFVSPTLTFLSEVAKNLGVARTQWEPFEQVAESAIRLVIQNQNEGNQKIAVDVFESEGNIVVEVLNRATPLFLEGESGRAFYEKAKTLEKVSFENLGRQGQTIVLQMKLNRSLPTVPKNGAIFDPVNATIDIRILEPGEEAELSRLFHSVYAYDYIQDFVYFPEKIRQRIEEKNLISIVAVDPSKHLVGHIGLMKWEDNPPVYEPCLGVVDPRFKSRGLFGKLFQKTMEWVEQNPMQYCFFDFVTNHDRSQKLVSRYHPCDLAIFVGCQSKETQASLERLGIGKDPTNMDRYSLLFSVKPCVPFPFGKEVVLPNALGELLGFILEPLNIQWVPASRFYLLPPQGDYQTHLTPSQNSVIFDLFLGGRKAVDKILEDWKALQRNGYEYCAIDVPIHTPGLGNLYDVLSEQRFFIAGLIPYHYSEQLAVRFQAITPSEVAWDEIKLFSETSKKLLTMIRNEFERNA